jgi:hypothetical protein
MTNVKKIIAENKARITARRKAEEYNPFTGEGSTSVERKRVFLDGAPPPTMWLPIAMLDDAIVADVLSFGSIDNYLTERLNTPATDSTRHGVWCVLCERRFQYDFEFWAAVDILITPKEGGEDCPFILNPGQRKLLKSFEDLRLAGLPIRIILCKARQWGGSTLTQIYMAWIQIIHKKNWNSVICAHLETASRIIKGMYEKAITNYPPTFAREPIKLSPYQGSQKTSIIKATNCRITIGSAEKPDGVRSENISMAHLSEVGLWKKTEGKKPEDIVQAVTSGIMYRPYTMVVYESTAKGVGTFFHNQWLRATTGKSAFTPVFVAWYEVDMYSVPIDNYSTFISEMSEYEWLLWTKTPATLEQINWYRLESLDKEPWRMKSEFPSFAHEAFQSTGNPVFRLEDILRHSGNCIDPIATVDVVSDGDRGKEALQNVRFVKNERGNLQIWEYPNKENNITRQYVVAVDIGGRSDKSDPSCITVFNREYMMEPGGVPEVVAEWHGHVDHDKLAWLAAMIATAYNNALLVFESNTYEMEETEGSHGEFILEEIAGVYDNIYARTSPQTIKGGTVTRYGFQTNRQTKTLIVDG